MLNILEQEGAWWSYWREKTFGSIQKLESLAEYAARVYCSDSPEDLGLLVAAFARCVEDQTSRYLSIVESLIIYKDEHGSTMKGLECVLLQAKCHLDFGQPRRAWLMYRRGLTLAQLINLHRNYTISPERACIWWNLYHGDRFASMLLGLPQGIDDANCVVESDSSTNEFSMSTQMFMLQCGKVMGKVISRNQAAKEPPFSVTVQIEEELESITQSMSPSWWEPSTLCMNSGIHESEVRTRLLTQAYFFHIRMYVHLSSMIKPRSDSRFQHSRKTCINSARELLRRFNILRSGLDGQTLFECKTNDFVGFTAAVVLLMGLVNKISEISPNGDQEGWRLIKDAKIIFESLHTEKKCKMAFQCHQALELLSSATENRNNGTNASPVEIFIPYFGKVSIRGNTEPHLSGMPPPSHSSAPENNGDDTAGPSEHLDQSHYASTDAVFQCFPTTESWGVFGPGSGFDSPQLLLQDTGTMIGGEELSPWWSEPTIDIDGDWHRFLD
ncbi:hypothetical protein K469DRAFT_678132 [Zopfia rhizophila CBS 207.26]|uniref:Xylanolytic transcriptional activator regulatory domain-containing protein n=1 Tax=Zopfia rhizophila CBS 207.26 TaxID=1314779 RepID=A0A6A6DBN6_9PEZI|nr:hypothetical protein K469DRAFT_678132 [Zopfia rhizophila CBS 207.26]